MIYFQYKKKYETKEKWAAKNIICLLIALEEAFNITELWMQLLNSYTKVNISVLSLDCAKYFFKMKTLFKATW